MEDVGTLATAIAALLVSVISLGFTVYTWFQQRRQQRAVTAAQTLADYPSVQQWLEALYGLQRQLALHAIEDGQLGVDAHDLSQAAGISGLGLTTAAGTAAQQYNAKLLAFYLWMRDGTNASPQERERYRKMRRDLRAFWDSIMDRYNSNQLPSDFLTSSDKIWLQRSENFKQLVEVMDIANYYSGNTHQDSGHYVDGKNRPAVYTWLEALQQRQPEAWTSINPRQSTAFAFMEKRNAAVENGDLQ